MGFTSWPNRRSGPQALQVDHHRLLGGAGDHHHRVLVGGGILLAVGNERRHVHVVAGAGLEPDLLVAIQEHERRRAADHIDAGLAVAVVVRGRDRHRHGSRRPDAKGLGHGPRPMGCRFRSIQARLPAWRRFVDGPSAEDQTLRQCGRSGMEITLWWSCFRPADPWRWSKRLWPPVPSLCMWGRWGGAGEQDNSSASITMSARRPRLRTTTERSSAWP